MFILLALFLGKYTCMHINIYIYIYILYMHIYIYIDIDIDIYLDGEVYGLRLPYFTRNVRKERGSILTPIKETNK